MGAREKGEVEQLLEELRHEPQFEQHIGPADVLHSRYNMWLRARLSIDPLRPIVGESLTGSLHDVILAMRKLTQHVKMQDFASVLAEVISARPLISRIENLEARVRRLEITLPTGRRIMVPITTLAPEPYDLMHQIVAVIEPSDEGFIAGFFDANIYASGDTEEEALRNLKSLILDVFDNLSAESFENLGPQPRRQLAVLQEFIARRSHDVDAG